MASVDEILRMHERNQSSRSDSLEQGEEQIAVMEKAFAAARNGAWETAEKVSLERQRAAKKLKREMEKEVKSLGMPETMFEARFVTQDEKADAPPFFIAGKKLTERGMDQVEFYFSPNPGEPAKPLAKIASGGELSRLMLALKALVLTPGVVSTLLFDEVDAGIGGRVAEIVGKKLKQVAAHHQVISVTHLPQIAALADCPLSSWKKKSRRGGLLRGSNNCPRRDRVAEVGADARRRQDHRARPGATPRRWFGGK